MKYTGLPNFFTITYYITYYAWLEPKCKFDTRTGWRIKERISHIYRIYHDNMWRQNYYDNNVTI